MLFRDRFADALPHSGMSHYRLRRSAKRLEPFPPGATPTQPNLPDAMEEEHHRLSRLPSASVRAPMARTLSSTEMRGGAVLIEGVPAPEVGSGRDLSRSSKRLEPLSSHARGPQTSTLSTSSESSTAVSSSASSASGSSSAVSSSASTGIASLGPSPVMAEAAAVSAAASAAAKSPPRASPREGSDSFSWSAAEETCRTPIVPPLKYTANHTGSERIVQHQAQSQMLERALLQQQAEQPPRHAEQPPRHAEQQPRRAEQPPRHAEQQPRRAEQQPRLTEQPPRHAEQQPRLAEQQPRHTEQQQPRHQHPQHQLRWERTPPRWQPSPAQSSTESSGIITAVETVVPEAKWSEQRAAAREARARRALDDAVGEGLVSPAVAATAEIVLTRESRLAQPLPRTPAHWKKSLRGPDEDRPGKSASPPPPPLAVRDPTLFAERLVARLARDLEKAAARRPQPKKPKVDWLSTLRGDDAPLPARPATTYARKAGAGERRQTALPRVATLRSRSQGRAQTAGRRTAAPFGSGTVRGFASPSRQATAPTQPTRKPRRTARSAGPAGREPSHYQEWQGAPPQWNSAAYGGYYDPWGYQPHGGAPPYDPWYQQQAYGVDPYGGYPNPWAYAASYPPAALYAPDPRPPCVACGAPVDDFDAAHAGVGTFHQACFACVDCGETHLMAKGYFEVSMAVVPAEFRHQV